MKNRHRFLGAIAVTVLAVAGSFFYLQETQAEENQNFSVIVTVLAPDGSPNTNQVHFIMTTDLGFDAKTRDKYDIYAYNVTSGFTINQSNGQNPIRPMAYWICSLQSAVIPSSPLTAKPVPPHCQQVDFRSSETFNLTFQYRQPNKLIHGKITDEKGNPLASVLNDNLFYVLTAWRPTATYYRGGDQYSTWTDADGNYLLALSDNGGTFDLGAQPTSKNYLRVPGYQQTITFANDTTVENPEINFVISRVGTSVLAGRVVDKHGDPMPGFTQKYSISVNAYQTTAPYAGSYLQPGADGTFSLKVTAGTYNVFINYLPHQGNGQRINYPSQVVTVADGQTLSLGDIYPQKEAILDPDRTEKPAFMYVNGNERETAQTRSTKQARFSDLFTDLSKIDGANTAGVTWLNGAITMNAIPASSQGFSASAIAAARTTPIDAIITSKPVTPKNLKIKTATLVGAQTSSGSGKIYYQLSPDGMEWANVVPGQAMTIPTNWDTKNGLRWRAKLQRTSSSDVVKVSDIQINYVYQALRAAPLIQTIKIKRASAFMKITVRGKYISQGAALYIGGRKAAVTIKNGTVSATIRRSLFPRQKYQITVVNPDLQYSSTPKINVLVPR